MEYLNARIGNSIVHGIKQRFNEAHVNNSGETLTTFCAQNDVDKRNIESINDPTVKNLYAKRLT